MARDEHDTAKVSAVVIAYNDEPNIRACLESLKWADEIVVVDSFSTDGTEQISREFTDNVLQHKFEGFGRLRNTAVAHAKFDWIFSLDTDERTTEDLIGEIRQVLKHGPKADAYFVPRRNYFLGKWIRHCGWYPNYRQPQFFHRERLQYRENLVHEEFDVQGATGYLKAHVEQIPFRNIDHCLSKMDRYSSLMATELEKRGQRFKVHQLVTHPAFTFFKMYLLQGGILDGKPGLILSGLYAYYTFVKYAKLWDLGRLQTNMK